SKSSWKVFIRIVIFLQRYPGTVILPYVAGIIPSFPPIPFIPVFPCRNSSFVAFHRAGIIPFFQVRRK
ncbi:MAG: hypothetical protein KAX05_16160, partial [Bacteroidales bacterium]|nr:hypothetical protein [Bacteroidales bacterium]